MDRGFQVLTPHEVRTLEAAFERLFPADTRGPGAAEIGVVLYVDRALGGADHHLRGLYARGVETLDQAAKERQSHGFADCTARVQDDILAAMEEAGSARAPDAARLVFETLLVHLREGLFADPIYGGNRELAGWKLLGYPGLQLQFGAEDWTTDARVTRERVYSLADWGIELIPGYMQRDETTR